MTEPEIIKSNCEIEKMEDGQYEVVSILIVSTIVEDYGAALEVADQINEGLRNRWGGIGV